MANPKVIDQQIVDANIEPPEDGLGHDAQADALYMQLKHMSNSSVIAIQAPWGRGKTDFMWRLARRHNHQWTQQLKHAKVIKDNTLTLTDIPWRVIWLNSWRIGSSDFITPVVMEMIKRIANLKTALNNDSKWLENFKNLASMLLRASALWSVNYGTNQALSLLGVDKIIDQAKAKKIVETLWEKVKTKPKDDFEKLQLQWSQDPIGSAPYVFEELVRMTLVSMNECFGETRPDTALHKLVIFIDDFDRCLPEQQVRILESIHFLTSSNAQVVFVVGIDMDVALDSLKVRYNADSYGVSLYLDKIFDHQIRLNTNVSMANVMSSLLSISHPYRATGDGHDVLPDDMTQTNVTWMTTKEVMDSFVPGSTNTWCRATASFDNNYDLQNLRLWQRITETIRICLALGNDANRTEVNIWLKQPSTIMSLLLLREKHENYYKTLNEMLFTDNFEQTVFASNSQISKDFSKFANDFSNNTHPRFKSFLPDRNSNHGKSTWLTVHVPAIKAFNRSLYLVGLQKSFETET